MAATGQEAAVFLHTGSWEGGGGRGTTLCADRRQTHEEVGAGTTMIRI